MLPSSAYILVSLDAVPLIQSFKWATHNGSTAERLAPWALITGQKRYADGHAHDFATGLCLIIQFIWHAPQQRYHTREEIVQTVPRSWPSAALYDLHNLPAMMQIYPHLSLKLVHNVIDRRTYAKLHLYTYFLCTISKCSYDSRGTQTFSAWISSFLP